MAVTKYVSGSFVLTSPEAIHLYDSLASQDQLLEYMSVLFEQHAQAKGPVREISEKLEEILTQIKNMGGAGLSASPNVSLVRDMDNGNSSVSQQIELIEQTRKEVAAKTAPPPINKLGSNFMEMANKMRGMNGPK